MNPIRSILVIVDPTATAQHAVDKGALLASKLHARIELFVCETKTSQAARLAAHARANPGKPFQSDVKGLLETLAEPLRKRGLDVATETQCADPLHVALAERTKRTNADLVIKDTHHHSIAHRTFMTNTDWNLIRSCPVPLLLVKERAWSEHARICAAVDPGHANDKPTELDHRILECAAAFAKTLDGELHAVHAYVPVALIAAAAGGAPPMVVNVPPGELQNEEALKRKQVEDLVASYGLPGRNIHLELGGPGELIPRVARSLNVDIMTMGAISRSGLKRVFVGATAEDVLERLPCDALVVKAPNFAEDMSF